MSIHINQVLDYFDEQLVCQRAGDMHSLMEMIHEAYTTCYAIDSEKMRQHFCELREILNLLPAAYEDLFYAKICDLCLENEVLAFSQGVVAGMLLMTEVNRLP